MTKINLISFLILMSLFSFAGIRELYAKGGISDQEIFSRLQNGEGGFIVRYQSFVTKKNYKEPTKQYASLEEFLSNEMERKDLPSVSLFILTPENGNREIEVKSVEPEKDERAFVVIGAPGDYVVSRALFGSAYQRLFGKVSVEPKKLKYVGDLVVMTHRNLFKRSLSYLKIDMNFNPSSFEGWVGRIYPRSSGYVSSEKMKIGKE